MRKDQAMQKIYLATPYKHPNPDVRQERYQRVTLAATMLILMGYNAYSPITHNYPIMTSGKIPGGWDFWGKFDSLQLIGSDMLVVLRLPGWEQSTGVTAEIGIAKTRGMPTYYLDDLIVAAWDMTGRLPSVEEALKL